MVKSMVRRYIIVSGLMGNSLSGASMNPARSLAPALFAGGQALTTSWIFIVGPLCGATLGAMIYEALRGSEQDAKLVLDEVPLKKA